MIKRPFERVSPESCGVMSADIWNFVDRLCMSGEDQETHGFMLLRHGKVLAEGWFAPFSADMPHALYSITKAFTSTAVGFAVQENLFSIEDRIVDYFQEYLPERPCEGIVKLKIRHLLMMATGQAGEPVHQGGGTRYAIEDWAEAFLNTPLEIEPGTKFSYNGFASYMLAALVQKQSGQDLMDYLEPRLFKPLGIEKPYCVRDKKGICVGWSGMRITVEELAAFGQFYLQKGMWEGKQLLNSAWIELASTKHMDTNPANNDDWSQGYCFHFWRGRYNTYRFCGAFGQMCVIMPDYDAVFVIQSGYNNDKLNYILDSFYETIMLRMKRSFFTEDPEMFKKLKCRLSNMTLPQCYSATSPLTRSINGTTYDFDKCSLFSKLAIHLNDEDCDIHMTTQDHSELYIKAGFQNPIETGIQQSKFVKLEREDHAIYSSTASWKTLNHLMINARLLPTQTILRMSLYFYVGKIKLVINTIRGNIDIQSEYEGYDYSNDCVENR